MVEQAAVNRRVVGSSPTYTACISLSKNIAKMPTASEFNVEQLEAIAKELDGLNVDDATDIEKNIFEILRAAGVLEIETIPYGHGLKNLSYKIFKSVAAPSLNQPTLTDEERAAIEWSINRDDDADDSGGAIRARNSLRGLLERTK